MTESTETASTAEPTGDNVHADNTVDKTQPPADDARNSEAAGFRRRLRDAEAERDTMAGERDTLADQLATMRRSEVERLAGAAGLSKGADVWIDNAELAALLDGDGRVDAALVAEVVAGVLAERPGLAAVVRRSLQPDPSQGRDQAAPKGADWSDVIASARR